MVFFGQFSPYPAIRRRRHKPRLLLAISVCKESVAARSLAEQRNSPPILFWF
jgi:hypothetical protein